MAQPVAAPSAHWLNEERVRIYSLLIVLITGAVFALWVALSLPGFVDRQGKPIGYDFITFWSAARLALDGRPEAAFDPAAIVAMQHQAVPALGDVRFLWHYPPTFLLLILPLGLLPYACALVAFTAATVALWAGLVRALFHDKRAWLVAAATPAGLINLLDGQNGFLTAGLAGLALVQLERRPRLAGTLIGLLAVKPHLAVLFPVALVAARRWQAIGAAALSATAFSALALAAFGPATALAFLHDLPTLHDIVDRAGLPWGMMPSVYVLMLSLHAPPGAAALAQGLAAFAAALCVWRAWRRPTVPFEAKAAVLCTASLLVSPYLFTYDLTWAALAIGFLAILGLRDGFGRFEREIIVAAWFAPLLLMPIFWVCGVQFGAVMSAVLLGAAMRVSRPRTSVPG